jgi:hypothetical protein
MMVSAQQANASGGIGDSVIGWKLDPVQRGALLQQFPPLYRKVVADHVTLRARAAPGAPLPAEEHGEMIGRADDGKGVEAMVIAIAGHTGRPDGSSYHITWSLAEGRQARESNDVIAEQGWEEFDVSIPVKLVPARWP